MQMRIASSTGLKLSKASCPQRESRCASADERLLNTAVGTRLAVSMRARTYTL
jgi:hypothetical protein